MRRFIILVNTACDWNRNHKGISNPHARKGKNEYEKNSTISVACFFLVHSALAQTNRQISGIITDAVTKEPLAGVNITIIETTLGVASDNDGHYKIMNLPPEKYKIKVSMIGYETVVRSILVSPEKTVELNFSLQPVPLSAPGSQPCNQKWQHITSLASFADLMMIFMAGLSFIKRTTRT